MSAQHSHKALFAHNLRVLRTAKGLTQLDLARRLGKSRATVIAWEDPAKPTLPHGSRAMEELASALGTTVRALNFESAVPAPAARVSEPPPPRYLGRELPRFVDLAAKKFEIEAMETLGATDQEMGVIRTALYSSETVLMFAGGYDDSTPMTDEEKVMEMEALVEKLRAWLKERIRRRTQGSKRKR